MEPVREITVTINWLTVTRSYSISDPIWNLEREKQERKVIADAQRDLAFGADRRSQERVVERG